LGFCPLFELISNTTKYERIEPFKPSNFDVLNAFDIDIVLFYTMPQAALIDAQQLGGPNLNPACFPQRFNDHGFLNFAQLLV